MSRELPSNISLQPTAYAVAVRTGMDSLFTLSGSLPRLTGCGLAFSLGVATEPPK